MDAIDILIDLITLHKPVINEQDYAKIIDNLLYLVRLINYREGEFNELIKQKTEENMLFILLQIENKLRSYDYIDENVIKAVICDLKQYKY